MFTKKRIIILVVVALGLVGFMVSRSNRGVEVQEIAIQDREVMRTVSASGTVKSKNEADLAFSVLGRLQYLGVEKGEMVNAGQYLATLDNFSESQSVQALKDARDVALRDRDLYVENYETNMSAVGGSDEYEIAIRRLNELVSKAEASYQAQVGAYTKTYLNSPIEGEVVDIYYELGEVVPLGSRIMKVADLNQKVFEIELEQEDFGFLQNGQQVDIELDAFPNKVFEGVVNEMPKYAQENGGFKVEIEFLNEVPEVLLGMLGDAKIILATTNEPVPSLTFDEIRYDIDENPYVYVLNDGKAQKQNIEIGLEGDIYTQVLSTISGPVIEATNDNQSLEEGISVKLK